MCPAAGGEREPRDHVLLGSADAVPVAVDLEPGTELGVSPRAGEALLELPAVLAPHIGVGPVSAGCAADDADPAGRHRDAERTEVGWGEGFERGDVRPAAGRAFEGAGGSGLVDGGAVHGSADDRDITLDIDAPASEIAHAGVVAHELRFAGPDAVDPPERPRGDGGVSGGVVVLGAGDDGVTVDGDRRPEALAASEGVRQDDRVGETVQGAGVDVDAVVGGGSDGRERGRERHRCAVHRRFERRHGVEDLRGDHDLRRSTRAANTYAVAPATLVHICMLMFGLHCGRFRAHPGLSPSPAIRDPRPEDAARHGEREESRSTTGFVSSAGRRWIRCRPIHPKGPSRGPRTAFGHPSRAREPRS